MTPAFSTERLNAFKVECDRPQEFYSVDIYIAFQRDEDVRWPAVFCTLCSGDVRYVEYIHTATAEGRKGLALDLLLALSDHLEITRPLVGHRYTWEGKRLFAANHKAFAKQKKNKSRKK